jgi:hypothetical protein
VAVITVSGHDIDPMPEIRIVIRFDLHGKGIRKSNDRNSPQTGRRLRSEQRWKFASLDVESAVRPCKAKGIRATAKRPGETLTEMRSDHMELRGHGLTRHWIISVRFYGILSSERSERIMRFQMWPLFQSIERAEQKMIHHARLQPISHFNVSRLISIVKTGFLLHLFRGALVQP